MRFHANNKGVLSVILGVLAVLLAISLLTAQSQTGAKETIALLPFRLMTDADDPGLRSFVDHINEELRSAIGAMGANYQVLERKDEQRFQGAEATLDSEQALRQVAENTGADFVISGSIGTLNSLYHMKGFMWDTKKERMAVRVDLKVPNVHALPSVLQYLLTGITKRLQGAPNIPFYKAGEPGTMPAVHQPRFRTVIGVAETEGPWRSPELAGTITGLAIGDLDGDKHNELVLVGDSGITIARFDKNALRPLTQFSKSPAVFLSVQAEDLDGDGVPELIICSQLPDGVESEVLRYLNRNLTVIETFPNMILACVPDPENPKMMNLLGQRTDARDMFSGEMISFSLRNGALKRRGKVTLPPGTLLLSYAAGDIQGYAHVQVLVDQRLKLRVFDQNNQLLSVQDGHEYGLHRKITLKTAEGSQQIIWPGRIVISDSSPSGQGELMLVKTTGGKSEIQGFHWGGVFLEQKWNTPPMEGAISDFKIGDFKNSGTRSLVLLLVRPDQLLGMSGPRSILFAYDFLP